MFNFPTFRMCNTKTSLTIHYKINITHNFQISCKQPYTVCGVVSSLINGRSHYFYFQFWWSVPIFEISWKMQDTCVMNMGKDQRAWKTSPHKKLLIDHSGVTLISPQNLYRFPTIQCCVPLWEACTVRPPAPPWPCLRTPWAGRSRARTRQSPPWSAGAGWAASLPPPGCWGCPRRRCASVCPTATSGSGPGSAGSAGALRRLRASRLSGAAENTTKHCESHIEVVCKITTCTIASCKWIWQGTAIGQAEQDPNLPCSASNVLGRVLIM